MPSGNHAGSTFELVITLSPADYPSPTCSSPAKILTDLTLPNLYIGHSIGLRNQ